MNKAKINSLYEQAHVIYETPYESSVVDPTIMSIHKHKVWDRYLFAELIVRESIVDFYTRYLDTTSNEHITVQVERYVKDQFGVAE